MDLDLAQLRALSALIDSGTFDAAATTLHVTPSALSQRIKALETVVGRVLVVRSRPVVATEAGQVLLRLARQVDLLAADATSELGDPVGLTRDHAEPPRPIELAIAANADSLATWMLPALAPLADRYCFDLRRADQERTTTLLREGTVMAAVTADAHSVPGCTVTPLGAMTYQPLASPAYLSRWFADGPTPAALRRAPVVVFDRDDDLQHRYVRRRLRRPVDDATSADPPVHRVPAAADFVEAVRLGMGWGMVPDLQSADLRAAGALVEFDRRGRADVTLHWQQWKLRSPALDTASAAVVTAGRAHLRQG